MNRRCSGFTFVEVVVVLAILAVTGLVAYPPLRATLEKTRMESAVRELAALLKYAREKSMAEQETVAVVLRKQEGDLTIFNRRGQSIKYYRLYDKVAFVRLILDGLDVADNRTVVWFYPDGRSTGVAMVVRHESGRQLRLKTDILTGNTRIYAPGESGFDDEMFNP